MTEEQTFIRAAGSILRESASTGGPLVMRCRIIEAGLGSSAYYVPEVLERDRNALAPIGTKSYWNHPTYTEEFERPERDAHNLAAVQLTEAEWIPGSGANGKGALEADFEFNEADRAYIKQFGKHLGMSIYAAADVEVGTIGEYTGQIVTKFIESPFNSVDVVTVAGAGGAMLSTVSEGLRQHIPRESGTPAPASTDPSPNTEGPAMELKDLEEALDKRFAALTEAIKETLKPAAAPATETDISAELEKVAESGLPKEVRAIAYQAVREGASADEEIGKQKALVESIKASLTADGTVVSEVAVAGGVEKSYAVRGWQNKAGA